jgi:hypothetical protein
MINYTCLNVCIYFTRVFNKRLLRLKMILHIIIYTNVLNPFLRDPSPAASRGLMFVPTPKKVEKESYCLDKIGMDLIMYLVQYIHTTVWVGSSVLYFCLPSYLCYRLGTTEIALLLHYIVFGESCITWVVLFSGLDAGCGSRVVVFDQR